MMHSKTNTKSKWQPNITVAAIIEHETKFLIVTDDTRHGLKLNQPAGHIEENEDILAAVIREVKEETSLDFTPTAIVGIYLYKLPSNQTYLRFCFTGNVSSSNINNPHPIYGDDGVVAANWLTLDTIKARIKEHRTPFVMRCLNDYLANKRFSLDLISQYTDLSGITK